MPKAEAGSAKALANKMKSKGLQKLRWYCQVCEKQCRDENGFKCHTMSESHLRQMLLVGESAGKHISDYTTRFQAEFVALLSRRWGTKRVRANQVYQEYITDKQHLHMNATRFLSLTEFVKHLGRTGVAHVDETEKGWWIQWIDNSPRALAKAEASQKKERGDMDDEMRQRKLIQEQIERAREEGERRRREVVAAGGADGAGDAAAVESGAAAGAAGEEPSNELKRADDGEKLSLSLSFNKSAAAPAAAAAASKPPSPPAADASASPAPAASTSTTSAPTAAAAAAAAPAPPPAAPASTFIAPPPKPVIGFTPRANPLSAKPPKSSNPLAAARPNPLKGGGVKKTTTTATAGGAGPEKRKAPAMSAMEQIALDEMARKQRRMHK
ncbi:Rts2p [Rhodotorula paludigena]|uniref:Rts2p n=1 Tax=Rhodotorula paludigena TaxID=86838 RepID=UPI003174242C